MATKAELEIEVEYLKGQLSEKEGELATANEQITERDSRIEDLNQQIADANEGHDENRVADLERQSALMEIAQTDARRLLACDPKLTSPRGKAARILLWLLDQDRAIKLISVG